LNRLSLRARLLIGLVALVAIGLGAAAIATYEEQRSFLFRRVDQQVVASELPVSVGMGLVSPRGPMLKRVPPFPSHRDGLPARPETTFQASGTYGELLDGGGRVLRIQSFTYGGTAASPPALPGRFPVSRTTTSGVHLFTVHSRSGSGLRYRAAGFSVGQDRVLVIAVPLRDVDQTLHRLIVVEGLVGGALIIALVALGWIVIRLGLRPLERIERVASDISHGDLSRRVSSANPRTEVGRLGASLNEMLVQIERAFADRTESEDRLRRFLSDASHELRTPLAAIRGYAELFRLGAVSDRAALGRALARIEAESARMGVLVEDLLLLASLDELPEVRRQAVDLCELVEHAAQDTRAIAPDRKIRLTVNGPLPVLADPDQLRQVMANLTRNALIHTPAGSPIDLKAYGGDGHAVITVRDHGPGLPGNSGDRVFERFWRTEGGRSRGRGGAGLGLAIVKAIVEAHQGQVHARNVPDGGAEFVVTIPSTAELLAHSVSTESVGTRELSLGGR
jgi:two-component system OmpR family sensor kinase